MNDLKGTRIEYHILQSFPVTCLNRDDVGAPKSAMIGGSQRARVSSQCWKRQVRLALHDLGVQTGIRTKKVEDLLYAAFIEQGASEMQARECSEKVAKILTDNTLLFFSRSEANAIAEFARTHDFKLDALIKGAKKDDKNDDKKEGKKGALSPELKKEMKNRLNPAFDGLDIALFGRMVAQDPDMNMQAACSFAHAITTHKASNEVDFFTALDDLKDNEPGSAHMGALEFNSGTYYRYVSLDLGLLAENIGRENVADAVRNFTKALYIAVPSARQTTQTGLRPWDYARVQVRKGQGMQASFEKPVYSRNGYLEPSMEELDRQLEKSEKLAGSLFGKKADYILGKDANFSIDDLADALVDTIERTAQ